MACHPHDSIVVRGLLLALALAGYPGGGAMRATAQVLEVDPGMKQGICVVLGMPAADRAASVIEIATERQMKVYFQSPDAAQLDAVRRSAAEQGLLGTQVFAEQGALSSLHLANNLADIVLVSTALQESVSQEEILRVLRPAGKAMIGTTEIVKPQPAGVDSWSHVYHGPDNNPQSTDQIARAPYRTQFLGGPLFSPMPEVTVAAGGRIFKAFGHIAHKANQTAVLNQLYCINAFNGAILWTRDLTPGYMIHRNTMIATPEILYLADDTSCKLIDTATGQVRDEIIVPDELADGSVWKWMALQDGVLYALVGGSEIQVDTVTSTVPGIGHWPWGMWKGHDYSDPRTNFGFGRTFLAIDPATKAIRWHYRDDQYIDSRGVCMNKDRIFFCSPERFVACVRCDDGSLLWKNSEESLLQAIGPNESAQHYVTGYSTTAYIKCNDRQLFFAGPQRNRFVVASTEDGRLLWEKRQGNVQVVLRHDGIYCAGPESGDNMAGAIYSYEGDKQASLPIRRACTRATGSIDSVFYRTSGGTVRVNTADNTAQHIAPMRPPCQDGVVISDGLLFWGPWMCGCQLSLYGHISLGPAGALPAAAPVPEAQWQRGEGDPTQVQPFPCNPGDWFAYQHDSWRSDFTRVDVPANVKLLWQQEIIRDELPTAPIVAGDTVFVADRSGLVRALDKTGKTLWTVPTGGPIYYPPALAEGRLYVGSADGRVYALEAATGRLLWSYRVSPEARWIPVYGRLISTWPVAGGVVVQDGVVYAAAGIAHYDGTHVVALDAVTGKVVWKNDTSGTLAEDVNCGISLQGELQVRGDELQFLGGGAYLFARYNRQTGVCLNPPRHEVSSQFQTAFYPYFPMYAKYSSLNHTFPDGNTLAYFSSYDGSQPTQLRLLAPPAPATDEATAKTPPRRANAPQRKAPSQPERDVVWQTEQPELYTAFVVTPDVLLAAGPVDRQAGQAPTVLERLQRILVPGEPADSNRQPAHLSAISLTDGQVLWRQELPAPPVKAGMALDSQGRIVVTLENGQLLCFGPTANRP